MTSARPKKRNYRKKTIYLTDAEYQRVRDKLLGSGHSFSAYCRGLLLSKKLVDHRSIPAHQFRELSAIGNNLNQLARIANQSKALPDELAGLLGELKAHLREVREAL